MRYIGSKTGMLDNLTSVFPVPDSGSAVLLDIFGGTGAVGRHFKPLFTVHANDLLYFSHALLHARIVDDAPPPFTCLTGELGGSPYDVLNALDLATFPFSAAPFVHDEFSPGGPAGRMYFRPETALHIDAVRQQIARWAGDGLLRAEEELTLIAALVDAVPSVSNIAGTYGAFLKGWDPRTTKPLRLAPFDVVANGRGNRAFNQDATDLIDVASGDVLYLDPPYNARQYASNYHVLETIALYDAPVLHGKTGTRKDSAKASDFCKRGRVEGAFARILATADFRSIVVSYSDEGLVSEQRLVELIEEHARPHTLAVHRFPYRRYARLSQTGRPELNELVLVAQR